MADVEVVLDEHVVEEHPPWPLGDSGMRPGDASNLSPVLTKPVQNRHGRSSPVLRSWCCSARSEVNEVILRWTSNKGRHLSQSDLSSDFLWALSCCRWADGWRCCCCSRC